MPKKDKIEIFIDEIYSKPPMRNYPTKKFTLNHIDEIWSVDLAEFSDYKTSNNKRYRFFFIIFDNLSKYVWATLLQKKNSLTIKQEFSKLLTQSKRSPLKWDSDTGSEGYNSIFQNFLRLKNKHHYTQFTDKGLPKAERVFRTVRNL